MEGTRRFGFILLVVFFAGSVVLMAAHELRRKTMRQGDGDALSAQKLIKELRSEAVVNREDGYVDPEAMPLRRPGGYLHEKDRQKLNSLIQKVVPSTEE